MKIIFFSTNMDIVEEWIVKYGVEEYTHSYDLSSLNKELLKDDKFTLIIDYNTVSSEVNRLISLGTLPENCIVLEREPEIVTGKMLVTHGVKAYGNSRMLKIHFSQMLKTVESGDIWTYPELTAALVKSINIPLVSEDTKKIIENRLSPKEIEVVYLVLDGLTNNVIASRLDITTRTVKAHVSSIFSKLHVSDRISLILLLR